MSNQWKDEDELDLSDMIDEYEEDQELRKKIDAMKQAKQNIMQETQGSSEITTESNDSDTIDDSDGFYEDNDIVQPEMSDEIGKTRVVVGRPLNDSDFTRDEESDRIGDSIHMYENREMLEEEITDEDIEEFLGNDREESTSEKAKMDPAKMNKIITYAITGIVALFLLIGVGIGVKALVDHSGGEDKVVEGDKEKDQDKEKDKDDDEEGNKPITDNNKEQDDDPEDKQDNSKRIAEINGKIKANEKQIAEHNKQIEQAKKVKENYEKNKLGELLASANTKKENVTRRMSILETEIADYEGKCTAEDRDEAYCNSVNIDDKRSELQALNNQLSPLDKEIADLNKEKEAYDRAFSNISKSESEITRLNNENTQLNNELRSLSQ